MDNCSMNTESTVVPQSNDNSDIERPTMQRQPARASYGRFVSRLTSGTLAIVMAGGRGERLKGLTVNRCKPATPFGGKFRIIDFVLSNCVNSGIRQISILTQYKQQPLIQHVQQGWSYLRGEFGEFVEVIPAQQQIGEMWYRGTSDALYLYYTLGKLEIMKLRADLQQRDGASFSLQRFHDNFMRQGFAPIKVVRKAMLHDDSPVL